jgi:uncharacterized SAM-binding protein YcdF (DUF218 family)
MGVPVVATDLPEIRRFNADHGAVIAVAADADAFAAAIRRALDDSSPAEVEHRLAVAQANSWESRIAAMNLLIDQAVERRSESRGRWDVTLRRVYRETRGRLVQTSLAVVAIYLLVFHTNLVWWAASPLNVSRPPQLADVIVVFGGGVGESGKAGGGGQERLERAVELYHAGDARSLVLSSGYMYSFPEAEEMRALAVDRGIPPAAIVLEKRATNTYQNVAFVRDILRDHHWTSVLLVSSPYHMRRALLVWQKLAPDIRVTPTPPLRSQFYDHVNGASLEQLRGIVHEYAAILTYWRRGWI